LAFTSELYEKSATYTLSALVGQLPAAARRHGSSTLYRISTRATRDAMTSRNRIHIQWSIQGGTAEIVTISLFDRPTIPFDTRWLLIHP